MSMINLKQLKAEKQKRIQSAHSAEKKLQAELIRAGQEVREITSDCKQLKEYMM